MEHASTQTMCISWKKFLTLHNWLQLMLQQASLSSTQIQPGSRELTEGSILVFYSVWLEMKLVGLP